MLHTSIRRTLQGVGVVATVGALAMTCAATANAAPKPPPLPSTASAQAFAINLPGVPAIGSEKVVASNAGKDDISRKSTGSINIPNDRPVLGVGVAAGTAVARRNGISFSCAGIVQPGGTISVGADPASCGAKGGGSGARGISIDLQGLTGLSLPIAVGDVDLYFNAITAFASQDGTTFEGAGKPINTRLVICPGIKLGTTACPVKPITIPIIVSGAPNQDVLPAVLDAISNAKLGIIGTLLSNALRPVLQLRTNVQTFSGGVHKVVGVQLSTVLGASVDLGVATTGPNN